MLAAGVALARLVIPALAAVLIAAPGSHAAGLGVRVEAVSDGASSDTVTFADAPSADGLIRSLTTLKVAVDAPGAAWRLVLHSSNPDGRPGLRPIAAGDAPMPGTAGAPEDTDGGVPLVWQVHEIRNPLPASGLAYRDSWIALRDHRETGWPDALARGEAVVATGIDRSSTLAPWPLVGRAASSPFYVQLAADAGRASAGEYAALLTVDLILLGGPPVGPRLHLHRGRVVEEAPELAWRPAEENGLAIVAYLLQVDTTGVFEPGALVESRTLLPGVASWRPSALPEGFCHWRVLAVDIAGNVTPSDPPADSFLHLPLAASSPGRAPLSWSGTAGGYRVHGNAISLVSGYRSDLMEVVYEVRPVPGGSWQSCVPLGGTSNPDTRGPLWGMLWDLSALAPGYYDVRARAVPISGPAETSPAVVRIYRTEGEFALSGDYGAQNGVYRESILMGADTSCALALFDGSVLNVPRGAAGNDSAWLFMVRHVTWPAWAPALFGWTPAGLLHEFGITPLAAPVGGGVAARIAAAPASGLSIPAASTLSTASSSAPRAVEFATPVEIAVPWDPAIPPSSLPALGLFQFDPGSGSWTRVAGAIADSAARVFRATVDRVGSFAVFSAAVAPDANSVLVFPNPFVPNDASSSNGVPWTSGNPASGITFGNLPDRAEISIYSLAGERLIDLRASSLAATLQWDARNRDGRELASGVYLALIRGGSGAPSTRKIMIIR